MQVFSAIYQKNMINNNNFFFFRVPTISLLILFWNSFDVFGRISYKQAL